MKLVLRIAAGIVGLFVVLVAAIAIYIYSTALTPSRAVGFQQILAADPGHRSVPVAIWYPSTGKTGFVLLGTRGVRLASDGPVDGSNLPLVVMSHGTGGSGLSHADTAIALAEAGFVVAAPTHPGDNLKDDSDVGKPQWLVDRSRHVTRSIDAVIGAWKDRSRVDPKHIGIFGLSAGGTTALIALGGKPNLALIPTECAKHPEFVCKILPIAAYRNLSPITWTADPRITAAVIAAPGLGFTFEPSGLAQVRSPVQLWAGSADQTVPYATNTSVVQQLLPHPPEVHVVPGALHLSFLMPCGVIGPPQFCRDPNGFDREAFHKVFNQSVVSFFRQHL